MNYQEELEQNITTADQLFEYFGERISQEEKKKYRAIIGRFPMSVPKYYLSLIDPDDPHDVIRKMCIPSISETDLSGSFDTSGEKDNTVMRGLQHKYKKTALVLSTNRCAMYCRHCFRKRLVGVSADEIGKEFEDTVDYVRRHTEISNVLISGGDAFLNSNAKIERYLEAFSGIEHLDLIRFGTRTPAVLPSRIYGDPELLSLLKKYKDKKQIYVVTHFNHPREITPEARRAVRCLLDAGVIIKNQTVLLKGINDSADTLASLLNGLTRIGVIPYYVFQCRPVSGVKNQFQVPLIDGYKIISGARKQLNGQGKCFRYIMSTEKGKIEVLGLSDKDTMLFAFHQSKFSKDENRIFAKQLEKTQSWITP